jgi:hypothetical protein
LSTALNSNALNVTVGLAAPAVVAGLGRPASATTLVAAWYLGLTALALVAAFSGRGLNRKERSRHRRWLSRLRGRPRRPRVTGLLIAARDRRRHAIP